MIVDTLTNTQYRALHALSQKPLPEPRYGKSKQAEKAPEQTKTASTPTLRKLEKMGLAHYYWNTFFITENGKRYLKNVGGI